MVSKSERVVSEQKKHHNSEQGCLHALLAAPRSFSALAKFVAHNAAAKMIDVNISFFENATFFVSYPSNLSVTEFTAPVGLVSVNL